VENQYTGREDQKQIHLPDWAIFTWMAPVSPPGKRDFRRCLSPDTTTLTSGIDRRSATSPRIPLITRFKIPKNRKINTSDRNSRITAFCADGQCVVWQVSASAWVSARFVASGLEIVRED
jgi:hypothetical protein